MYSIIATQPCSSDVHLSIKWPKRVLCIFNNLIKFDTICTELVYVFLANLSFQLVLGTRLIQRLHTIMTLVLLINHWIRNQEIIRISAFYLISFNIMVGFKVKARASTYFTELGWRRGCVCVCGGVCVCVCVFV